MINLFSLRLSIIFAVLIIYQASCKLLQTNAVINENRINEISGSFNLGQSKYMSKKWLSLSNRTTRDGGAIFSVGNAQLTVTNCVFQNIKSSAGAIFVKNSLSSTQKSNSFSNSVNLIVVNSTFEGNIADSKDGAGAIYLEDVFNVVISNSSFISNNAETGDGGAIKLKCSVSNCGATLNSNVFKLNQAGTKGGAISWNLNEPQNILLNTYANNTALKYGDDIGSVVSYLAFITKDQYESMSNNNEALNYPYNQTTLSQSVNNHVSGSAIETQYIGVFDKYNQIVSYGYSNKIDARKNDLFQKLPTTLSGSTSFIINNGVAKIEDLELFCTPNSTQIITLVYTENIMINLTVNVRQCNVGEELLSSGACIFCEGPSQYSLKRNFDEAFNCELCPDYANCTGGSEIYPKANYWRYSNETDQFNLCINSEACLDYDKAYKYPLGRCRQGYSGVLCDTCEKGYFRSTGYSCSKCPSIVINIISMIFMIVILVAYIIYIITSIYNENYDDKKKGDDRHKIGILIRMLINHFHLIGITLSYSFNWPSTIQSVSSYLDITFNINTSLISFDCIFERFSTSQGGLKSWTIQVIIYFALPIIIICLSSAFWAFYHYCYLPCIKKCKRMDSDEEIIDCMCTKRNTTSIIVLYILVLPSMIKMYSEMFNMVEIAGAGYSIIAIDSEQEADLSKDPFRYSFILAVTGTVLWGVIVLIGYYLKLRSIPDRNNKDSWYEFGYLYNGYKYSQFYWELVIQFRKVILIVASTALSTKGKLYQNIVLLIVIALFLIISLMIQPFADTKFNFLESFSLLTAGTLIYFGYLLSNENYSMSSSTIYQEVLDYLMIIIFFVMMSSYIIYWTLKLLNEISKKSKKLDECLTKFKCKNRINKNKIQDINRVAESASNQDKENLLKMLDVLRDNHEFLMEMYTNNTCSNKDEFLETYFDLRERLMKQIRESQKIWDKYKKNQTSQTIKTPKDESDRSLSRKRINELGSSSKYKEDEEIEIGELHYSRANSISKERTFLENSQFIHSKSQDQEKLRYGKRFKRLSKEESVNLSKEEDKSFDTINDPLNNQDEMNYTIQHFTKTKVRPYSDFPKTRSSKSRQKCYTPEKDEEEEVKEEDKHITEINSDLNSNKFLIKRIKHKHKND